jgi:hypothetical protein
MLKGIQLFILLCGMSAVVYAQELYMPRNIKAAYANGTRDKSGKPGKAYWQNTGRYDIQLAVHPPSRTVVGTETISYVNNSPESLSNIVIRLLCNLHKYQAPRSGYVPRDFLTENGVTIDRLVINGKQVPFNNDIGTVGSVDLPQPLNAHDSLQLKIDWHYDLSLLSGREGMIDSTTCYLAYAYPRVSVYDDYNQWDKIEHSDRTEFYSDFNDYRVAVRVPANYVVWGTGDLLNASEVLQPEIAKRLQQSYTSDETMHIATQDEMLQHKITQQKENVWRFSATHIADVTYGLSDHYDWDAASVIVDSVHGRRSSIQAAYNDSAVDFHHSVEYSHNALHWFSTQLPGVPYPFPKMTAFQGLADMEYPMMVNDGTEGNDLAFAQLVQDHEIAHTYFPFYMGINETRYAFMDEGWATTFEYLIGIAEQGKEKADKFYQMFRVRGYITDPSGEEDQPIVTQSNQVSGVGYGHNSYGKASLSYLALRDMLGNVLFKKALHAYMDNWHGKHPIPWDYFNSINTATGQDLNWFWKNWFFSNNYIDLSVASWQQKDKKGELVVKNVGGFAIPFDVVLHYADGSEERVHETPAIWKGNEQATLSLALKGKVKWVMLDGGIFMDATPEDNKK